MKRDNITRKDLRKQIFFDLGIPDSLSYKILNSFFNINIEGLLRDDEVKISGFGKFKILNKKERIGRNPKTNEPYTIKKRKVISFYPSLNVKKTINEKKE